MGLYRKILVALENSRADESLIPHIADLAALHQSELVLIHVADGWAARFFDQLKLAESEEMKADQAYLESIANSLRARSLTVSTLLALGDPAPAILKAADAEGCDLIAMTSHGHRYLGDVAFGSTITHVRHTARIPILLVRAENVR